MSTESRFASVAIAVACAALALSCTPRTTDGPEPTDRAVTTAPAVEAKATEALKRMSERLKKASAFRVHTNLTFDDVLPSGQRIQLEASSDVAVRRTDRFHGTRQGDLRSMRLWYDGKSVTLLGTQDNLYASFPAPPTIDAALDHAFDKFGIVAPAADLVMSDPYAVLMEGVQTAAYVGLHQVSGVRCHHLAFTQKTIDWQIWIEDGKDVPRKLVITYKELRDSPQATVVLSDWDFTAQLPDSLFAFKAPEGAQRIEFLEEAK